MYTYFVYILKCADDSLYTGITNNLDDRIAQHRAGSNTNSYTYDKRPIELIYCKEFSDVLQAIYFEKKIKGWSRKKKWALIRGDYKMLQILAECRNASHYKYKPE